MKIISTKVHAVLDYLSGVFFIASPWIFGFNDVATATWIPILIGATTLVMSLFTDYEGGMVRSIHMSVHLIVDVVSGIFLAVSPWLFGFADEVYLPHVILGIFAIGAGLLTTSNAPQHRPNTIN
jgi:hypothetical protein